MLENVVGYIEMALVIVGALATVVKGLEVIAGITPTTKDDLYVGKVKQFLGHVSYWLDRLSLGVKK
jgi:hypothetical protein